MTSEAFCISCRRPKAIHACGICQEAICKKCVEQVAEDAFSFLPEVPEELRHARYCPSCYDAQVAPVRESYDATLEAARQIFIFFTTQKKPVHLIRRAPAAVRVEACADRDETILRLAFLAAQQGFNAVIETDVTAEKVRNEGWQTSRWKGTGVPAQVDAAKLERDASRE